MFFYVKIQIGGPPGNDAPPNGRDSIAHRRILLSFPRSPASDNHDRIQLMFEDVPMKSVIQKEKTKYEAI